LTLSEIGDWKSKKILKKRCLSTDNLIPSWDITGDGVVSKNLQQVTDNWDVSLTNKFIVVQLVDDLVELVTVDNIVEVNLVDILNSEVSAGWVSDIITEDGVNIDNGWGHNSADDFLHVVNGKGLKDGVEFGRDTLGDQETLEKNVKVFTFNLGDLVEFGCGDNLLVNLDIDNVGWLVNNLGFSSDWLDDNFLVSWGNLNIRSDFGNITNDWLVDEEGLVDLV